MTREYQARLDKKTQSRILCGARENTCRGQLGELHAEWDVVLKREGGPDVLVRRAHLMPGFVLSKDGICRLSAHARKRRPGEGQTVKVRRIPKPSKYMAIGDVRDTWPERHLGLPAYAECPECGQVNSISWECLGVEEFA